MKFMNESYFKDVLAEICEEEIAELNKFPPFKPSLHHRFAMKRIFASFEKNTRKPANVPASNLALLSTHLHLGRRLLILFALIACAALLTGFMTVYFYKNFHGTVYTDNTHLSAINTENCLALIEYEYHISDLPDGYEMVEHDSSSFDVYTLYENADSGQVITLSQYTKNGYKPHYNTENRDLEKVMINGHEGLCIDFSDDEHDSSIVIWDNDDYVLQLSGELDKNTLLVLAKSVKVLKNRKLGVSF